MPSDSCAACDRALDAARYTRCDVCRGARYCVDCGRKHDGVADARYGVHE